MDKDETYIERFWEQVLKTEGCWFWTGRKVATGYGAYYARYLGKRYWRAHRLSWAIANGRNPKPGMVIAHSCHKRACVNPEHLKETTQRDNMDDMIEQGSMKGERHGRARLTEQDVIAIRSSPFSDRILAKRYGVHQTTIYNARRGLKWQHLPMPDGSLPS